MNLAFLIDVAPCPHTEIGHSSTNPDGTGVGRCVACGLGGFEFERTAPLAPPVAIPVPAPVAGGLYALGPPFLAIQVTRADARWIEFRLGRPVEGVPTRIRRRHWAGKDPVRLTPDLMDEIRTRHAAVSEAAEKGVHLAPPPMGTGQGARAAMLLAAVMGVEQ